MPTADPTALVTGRNDGVISHVVLNNPARRNALSAAMMRHLVTELQAADTHPSTNVIVISGAGPAFSAGHDLAEMRSNRDAEFYDDLFGTCTALMELVHQLRKPVIAQVHGVATAAGCQLVAACDLAVCAETARFATPGVNIGLFCSTPMVPISRAIGRKRAMEMLLTGTMIDAPTAVSWGLVNRAVPDDHLAAEVAALAETIATASANIVALGKRAFWDQIDETETIAYQHTAMVMTRNAQLDDAHEGMDAFLGKRSPQWSSGTDASPESRHRR